MIGVVSRILLRYLAAALVARGLVSADLGAQLVGDADILTIVATAVGTAVAIAVEGWYWLARRMGWAT